MALDDIVNVTITKTTATVSRVGFGTPMILSAEADGLLATTAKVYGPNLSELTDDGFSAAGTTAAKFTALISQNPKPSQIIVGKRSNTPTKTVTLTPVAKNSTDYTVTIGGRGPLSTSPAEVFTYTSDATATVAEITAGLVALIDAGTQNVNATDNTTDLTIATSATPGGADAAAFPFSLTIGDRTCLTAQDTTADPGLSTDISAVRTNTDGNDDWYCLILDSSGKAEIEAVASVIETAPKLFMAVSNDEDILSASTTDVASVLQDNNYARTALLWHQHPDDGPEAGWAGGLLPKDPGSVTWKFKTIAGSIVTSPDLSPSEVSSLEGKNGNSYRLRQGVSMTAQGTTGSGEFIDITRFIDFLKARIQERVFFSLASLDKVPFTDQGIAIIENDLRAVLNLGIRVGGLSNDPEPTITVPKAADVDPIDKNNRLLPDVDFQATLAGAIHAVEINGRLSV